MVWYMNSALVTIGDPFPNRSLTSQALTMPPIYLDPDDPLWDETDDDDDAYCEDDPSLTAEERSPSLLRQQTT
jgi:hypothetical protein